MGIVDDGAGEALVKRFEMLDVRVRRKLVGKSTNVLTKEVVSACLSSSGCSSRDGLRLMTKRNSDLRRIFREHLPRVQWTSIETGATAAGVPDLEYCFEGGAQGWLECKLTRGRQVSLTPGQVPWIARKRKCSLRYSKATICTWFGVRM
jgi:hypothetical protein